MAGSPLQESTETDRQRFAVVSGLDTALVRTELETVASQRLFHAQNPYRNGVTVYAKSVWGGNGFGNETARVAVRDGEVVAVYESERCHQIARVAGLGSICADTTETGHGSSRRRVVTVTALSRWIKSVKEL